MNAIPVHGAKNRLSYYLHLTDEQGPVFITNHGKVSYVIQNLKDYQKTDKLLAKNSFTERIPLLKEFREAELITDWKMMILTILNITKASAKNNPW